MKKNNILDVEQLDFSSNKELTDLLLEKDTIRIERIVSYGQTTSWYDQTENEIVFLLQGMAELEYANGATEKLQQGDWVNIPAHTKHRVSYTSENPKCIWLAIFY